MKRKMLQIPMNNRLRKPRKRQPKAKIPETMTLSRNRQ